MPAQATHHKIKLNLLYPQGVPDKFYIKGWRWLLKSGSYIIITVEVLVILTFLFKIKLHTDLKALQLGVNKQTKEIIDRSDEEAKIKQTQFAFETIKKNNDATPDWTKLLGIMSSQIPTQSRLTLISLEHTSPTDLKFKMNGRVPSSTELGILMSGLKKQPTVTEVTLSGVAYEQGVISFTMDGVITKEVKK
jgi:hypothetical protein